MREKCSPDPSVWLRQSIMFIFIRRGLIRGAEMHGIPAEDKYGEGSNLCAEVGEEGFAGCQSWPSSITRTFT